MKTALLIATTLALVFAPWMSPAEEPSAPRPYELEWAGRTQDHCPPLIDFEDLSGWRIECRQAEARWECSREYPIWGEHAGKLIYRGTGTTPEVRLLPPQPVFINKPFDAVSLWCYGNNWGWATDPSTPRVGLSALFVDSSQQEFTVFLYTVDWKEWSLLHRRLTPEQIKRIQGGASFKGLLVTGGRNREDRALYFDNLAVFTESFPPLTFEPRPARGIDMLPGQSAGANTGPGRLPFPTRTETILPRNLTESFTNQATVDGTGFIFTYEGTDGRLTYRLTPNKGTWSDLTAAWSFPHPPGTSRGRPETRFLQPCLDGGVYLQTAKGPTPPEQTEHLGTQLNGGEVESRWRLRASDTSMEVTYIYRLWNKSLVIDVLAPGGQAGEVRFGRALGAEDPRLVTNPFYPVESGRPAVLVSGPASSPLFLMGNADWYLSNGSILWAANSIATNGITYNGGTRYTPLTHGRRNDCFERFFITLSPRYEEVLPTIPNPVSPWRQITGTRLWRAHGASDRQQDARSWTEVHRYGMTQMVVTDHETMWRDEGESFTFRTKAAPGKGGDSGAFDYARLMQDKLGFVYGPYNNFTDFAPVNEFWNFDMVARDPQNQLQHAWMRCYAPKPARAVEYCARLAPQIQDKFRFSTAYCDVHTAVPPWHRVDYDPRVPGAGTFTAVFYSFGEIMLHQKKAWQGPVYSEGNYHCFYMGLTDGNYGQDQSYRPAENPWLVDFDLRQMHDLGCNFGMGNLEMFYANVAQPRATREERDAEIDRFLAATVAFGHSGFLVMEGGMGNALGSYYMLQQLHSRYCLTNAADIGYVAADGKLLDTSRAVATGAYQRSQVVTRYADGTMTAVNGSRSERLRAEAFGRKLDLPPNGYAGWTSDGTIEVLSSDSQGWRCDYAVTPDYIYVDGRGQFARFPKAAGNGIGICRILPQGRYEIILYQDAECGFAIEAGSAVALDKENKEIGPALLRTARGLTYVVPVKGAFSYLLSPELAPTQSKTSSPALSTASIHRFHLTCNRHEVVPSERVVVQGEQAHPIQIPPNLQARQRLWKEFEGAWIDFTVIPLADVKAEIDANSLRVTVASHLPQAEDFVLEAGDKTQSLRLEPYRATVATFDLGAVTEESAEVLPVTLRTAAMSQSLEIGLRATREIAPIASMPVKWTAGMKLRGQLETTDFGTTGTAVHPQLIDCGDTPKQGLFMHPPWQNGTGYAYAIYEPVTLPAHPSAAFRASVGKGSGSVPGDGILYKLAVLDPVGLETVVTQVMVQKHEWKPMEADLSPWAGKLIRLKLIADAGPRDDSSGDWAGWADMRIETLHPILHRFRVTDIERLRRQSGPHPVSNLILAELRQARSGRLLYEAKGLEGTGRYATQAVLNGLLLGEMTKAVGNEESGQFSGTVSIPLSKESLRSLGRRNSLILKNPNQDSFSIRHFWIELELADGRACSSDISTASFSQPSGWKYAEGIRIPADQDIEVNIWFSLKPHP